MIFLIIVFWLIAMIGCFEDNGDFRGDIASFWTLIILMFGAIVMAF